MRNTYDLRRRGYTKVGLTPEEQSVQRAILGAGYRIYGMHEGVHPYDPFLPTAEAYDVYRRYIRSVGLEIGEVELTPRQFGAALRAAFDLNYEDENGFRQLRVIKDVHGKSKRVWGYTGFQGPKSQYPHPKTGRPRKRKND